MARLYWNHGAEVDGPDEGKPREHFADYASYNEALLQAAHMVMVGQGPPIRIEEDGERVAWDTHFQAAALQYEKARQEGLSIDRNGTVTWDTGGHVAAMENVGRSG